MSDVVQTSLEELRALASLIQTSVQSIEQVCVASGRPFPSLADPFTPESEALRMTPEVQQAVNILVAAAAQLTAVVRPPATSALLCGVQHHISSGIRVVIEAHVVEILREAGPQGLHVKDIASPTQFSPEKLARVLRLLATHHIFREVTPDVFANNRISSCIDTGKRLDNILADPASKFDNTSGIAAIIGHATDESFKASAYLQEVLSDRAINNSGDPIKTSFNRAFNTSLPVFEWFEQPENAHRLRRFGMAMNGVNSMIPAEVIIHGFDWQKLSKDAIVVDVGGGVGSQSLTLAKAFDHLRFIVQDRASVISGSAPQFWKEKLPDAIASGRVKLQEHDFFEEQEVREPAVFLMRMILHDWADEYSIKILRRLRDAAGPSTQLVVVDNIMTYACGDSDLVQDIPGAEATLPPAPLLANHGAGVDVGYFSDMQMMNLLNSTERTVPQFVELFKKGGWKVARVHRPGNGMALSGAKIIGVPA